MFPSPAEFGWLCDDCFGHIKEYEDRYHCWDCGEYDQCGTCRKKKAHACTLVTHELMHRFTIEKELRIHAEKSLANLYHASFLYHSGRPFLGFMAPEAPLSYHWLTYKEIHLMCIYFFFGMKKWIEYHCEVSYTLWKIFTRTKVERSLDGFFLGICARNCLEWVISDLGSVIGGMVTTPIHITFSKEQKKSVLVNSQAPCLLVGTRHAFNICCGCISCSPFVHGEGYEILEEVLQILEENDENVKLLYLLCIQPPCKNAIERAYKHGVEIRLFSEIQEDGISISIAEGITVESLDMRTNPSVISLLNNHVTPCSGVSTNPLFTIMYTSGSTGEPKGVVISKEYWCDFVSGSISHDPFVTFSFCPLAHGMDRRNIGATFAIGGRVGIFEGDMNDILSHIQVVGPSLFSAIPRFWNKLHSSFLGELALETERSTEEESENVKNRLMDVYSNSLGPRIRHIVTGGAPTAPEVFTFMRSCFMKAMVFNGYGATEVGGITQDNRVLPNKGTTVKLVSVPDMGYFISDIPNPRGEICVKKDHMMSGYHRNPDATANAFTEDGYFKTGDIGEQVAKEQINIIARKKQIFKLAQGEFVAPESLENKIQSCLFIDQIFIYGNPLKEYLLAVIVPNEKEIMTWHKKRQIPNMDIISFREVCSLQCTYDFLITEICRMGLRSNFVSYEFPRGIIVEPESFSLENNKLTGPFKVNRRYCESSYQEELEKLYITIESNAMEVEAQFKELLTQIVRDTISSVAASVLGHEDTNTIGKNDNLLHFGLDSLSAMKMSKRLEESLGRKIELSSLLSATSNISELANAVSSNKNSLDQINWENEAILPPELIPLAFGSSEEKPRSISKQNVLLSGCTGFLGTSLLESLLSSCPETKIYCLIRKSEDECLEIFKQAWGDRYEELWRKERIQFLWHDLTKVKLGLSDEEEEKLAQEIDLIIHCGAYVNSVLPYSAVKETNVNGTLELLRLCTKGKAKIFHFVSTAGLLHGMDSKDVEHVSLPRHPYIDHIGGYSQSKWVAERLVCQAHERGLIATISRPSRISPHSRSNYWNKSDFMFLVIKGWLATRRYPQAPQLSWNLSAVDFVSDSILAIIQHSLLSPSPATPDTYNINNPDHCIPHKTIIEWIKEEDHSLYEMPYSQWKNTLSVLPSSNPILPLRDFFQGLEAFPCSTSPLCTKLYSLLESTDVQVRGLEEETFKAILADL